MVLTHEPVFQSNFVEHRHTLHDGEKRKTNSKQKKERLCFCSHVFTLPHFCIRAWGLAVFNFQLLSCLLSYFLSVKGADGGGT